jgi:hypothetical protein
MVAAAITANPRRFGTGRIRDQNMVQLMITLRILLQ